VRMRRALQFAAIALLITAALELLAPAAAMASGDAAAHSARLFKWIAANLITLIPPPMLTLLIGRTAARSAG